MPRHFEKRVLPYTPEQMYALVADVARYPEFLPWCLEATVVRAEQDVLKAVLLVGHKSFHDTFTSIVKLDPPHGLSVTYGGGPLKSLSNVWTFEPAGQAGCEITFFVSFEFKSFLLGAMMDVFFESAFCRMVSAFEQRAAQLYGESKCPS